MAGDNKAPAFVLLDEPAVLAALETLEGWRLTEDGIAIERNFRFRSFTQAFSFMTEMAMLAEKMNHHPEWSNTYGRVDVRLTNHAAGGVTDLDVHMAVMMNKAAARRDMKPV